MREIEAGFMLGVLTGQVAVPPYWNGSVLTCHHSGRRWLNQMLSERSISAGSRRYDTGMTKSKIAISLPRDQLERVHREVRAGRADSVSGYIAWVLDEHEKRESLRALLRDLIEQYGEPSAKDKKWAERALAQRRA
jgi:hypothetical protein